MPFEMQKTTHRNIIMCTISTKHKFKIIIIVEWCFYRHWRCVFFQEFQINRLYQYMLTTAVHHVLLFFPQSCVNFTVCISSVSDEIASSIYHSMNKYSEHHQIIMFCISLHATFFLPKQNLMWKSLFVFFVCWIHRIDGNQREVHKNARHCVVNVWKEFFIWQFIFFKFTCFVSSYSKYYFEMIYSQRKL